MPGLTGIISPYQPAKNRDALDIMVRSMVHETFHVPGTFLKESAGIVAGWVNPTGTFSDCLPVWNETNDVCLLFTGEVFPDDQEIAALKAKGHRCNACDASYLVHQYEELGDKFFGVLNGSFAGLVLDFRQDKAVLFNDRYGLSRIYFHETADGFYFSSEAKSLLKVLPKLRAFDPLSLGEFFSCGSILQNRTLFSGVSLLPPGSAWTFAGGRVTEKRTYFKIESWENQESLPAREYYERVKETWQRILPRYFRGNDRIGLSLTGGVDSRMILAWANRSAGSLPCYTFGGRYRDCADVRISRRVAAACGQKHEVLAIGEEFLSRFPALAAKSVYVSDGAMDVTGAVDLYVQELARRIAPVRITGTNGGEILRSLVAFGPSATCENVLSLEMVRQTRVAAQTYAQELQGRALSFTAFKQAPWHMGSKFVLERSLVTLRMPYFDNDLISLVYQAPPEAAASNELSRRLIAEGNPELEKIGTDRGGTPSPIPGLQRLQGMFQEFTFKAEYAYDYGMPQLVARLDRMLSPLHLERIFLGRHKTSHFRVYYRDELRDYVREMLLNERSLGRPYLDRTRMKEAVAGHLEGRRNSTVEIHKALTVELIQRHLIEQN